MATFDWITTDKTGGTGNSTVTVSASAYTGRVARSKNLTFVAIGGSPSAVVSVNQNAKPEFVSFDNSSKSVNKMGGSVTLTGKSNSKKLTFSLGSGGSLSVTLPSTYTAASKSTSNGANISGDPGSSAQYSFSITITGIAANETSSTLTKSIVVTDNAGHTSSCSLSQAAPTFYTYTVYISSNQSSDTTISSKTATLSYTYNGNSRSISGISNGGTAQIPSGATGISVSAPSVTGYKRTYSSSGRNYYVSYETEKLTVALSSSDGSSTSSKTIVVKSGSTTLISTTGSLSDFKIAFGTSYTVTIDGKTSSSYSANSTSRSVSGYFAYNVAVSMTWIDGYFYNGSGSLVENSSSHYTTGTPIPDYADSMHIEVTPTNSSSRRTFVYAGSYLTQYRYAEGDLSNGGVDIINLATLRSEFGAITVKASGIVSYTYTITYTGIRIS